MSDARDQTIRMDQGRFSRFAAIKWWDQIRVKKARVLVVGAGALGNEVIKNLALLGIGQIAVIDMDRIEESNLSRSILFRASDQGEYKVHATARAVAQIHPQTQVIPIVGNVLATVGLGWFRWADIVVGALDNREARLFVNKACAQVGRTWIDGGIDVLNGIVRVFSPPATACYECTMGQADWDLLAKRQSCSLLARRAATEGGTPTTPTTASVIGGIQAQEVVKFLHGLETLAGRGFVFEGQMHNSFTVNYPVDPNCPWHAPAPRIEVPKELGADRPLEEVGAWAKEKLGGLDAIDLSREIVESVECAECKLIRRVLRPLEALSDADVQCTACGTEVVPHFLHSLAPDSALLKLTARELGLPERDIVWPRYGDQVVGVELLEKGRPDVGTE